MADQNYGDSQQAVQVFYPTTATPGANLVPVIELSVAGRIASIVAGSNRYTVTSIGLAVDSATFTGSTSVAVAVYKAAYATGSSVALGNIKLPDMVKGDVARVAVSIDLLPGEVCFLSSGGYAVGTVAITFDGFTSQFGSTEGEIDKPTALDGTKRVINLTGDASDITPVVRIADLSEEGGDE